MVGRVDEWMDGLMDGWEGALLVSIKRPSERSNEGEELDTNEKHDTIDR